MAKIVQKTIRSKYKYVWGKIRHDKKVWIAAYRGWFGKERTSEREAAKDVDIYLLNKGKEPINILIRK